MKLVRRHPHTGLTAVGYDADRLLDNFFGAPLNRHWTEGWKPAVDLQESTQEYRVAVELPGVSKDDVKIEFTDGVLTIKGEKKAPIKVESDQWHRVERNYGAFERGFELPSPVDASAIKARFTDGILTITVPKAEEAKPREIQIEF